MRYLLVCISLGNQIQNLLFTIETEEAWVDAYMILSRRMMIAAGEEPALAA